MAPMFKLPQNLLCPPSAWLKLPRPLPLFGGVKLDFPPPPPTPSCFVAPLPIPVINDLSFITRERGSLVDSMWALCTVGASLIP